MTLATSPEQTAVCAAISAWSAKAGTADSARSHLDKPDDQWRGLFPQIADLGLFAAILPESDGGIGASFADVAAMVEQCGRELVPGPIVETVALAVALSRIADPRRDELVAAVAEGAVPGVVPARIRAGRGAFAVVEGAVDLGWVPGAADDAAILVPLAFDGGHARWRIVPAGAGVREVTAEAVVDGAGPVSTVRLIGLAEDDVIDCGAEGFDVLIRGVLSAGLAARQSGVCRWALDTAVDYAKVRTQFGVPIGSFQAIKHICADMLCRTEQVEAVAWDVARAVDDAIAGDCENPAAGEQLALAAAAAEVLVADLPVAVTKDCVQVLGGIGFTFEHDAHLYLRSALAARSLLGQGAHARHATARDGIAGRRRQFEVDLSAVEDRRADIRAQAEKIATAAESDRRGLLAVSGLLMPHWPAPHGLGADPALQLLIDAELDRVGVTRPDLVIGAWAIPTVLEHGTDGQRERFVAPTLLGDIVWCQLFSEPEAGSDLASLRTRATRVDGGWTLSGQKIWTSQAHNAQWGICLARTDADAPKHKGITYFLIDMSAPGIDIRPLRELTGKANFNEVFLDDVFVPDADVVGPIGGGWRLARTTLANERVAMGGSGLGKEMDALLTQVAGLGRELTDAELGGVGRLVADAHVGRVLDARAVIRRLAGHDPGALSSVRKLIGVAHRQSVPDFALDLLGVDGLTAGPVAELVLQNRCLSIAGGTTQILRTAAAEHILGLPRS
ncbi:acyl-CoA dehydrogenase [Gordonia sp. NB41Y]|uniref:acyl-CoA dehydrogenase n=1 Tax=Gordonia sp. NB41Y TaxID=875808 RepID=UPI0006B1E8E8|nr:acyl-CoA dehydrogenase [Gordonia sp. NB41Y]EMP10942.2 acyl-CoA dehydrogenase [Gordonia sp. NB41Y]WLP89417.1 acyl-CoA dehydrogenase [Gordonia sp. NB41Y]